MTEIWIDIPETDGQYQISNLGNARSLYSLTRCRNRIYRIRKLSPKPNPYGYLHVSIRLNGKRVSKFIHTLVAKQFVPNNENKPQVNHIDGNKKNNIFTNLEWVTAKENQQHAISHGLRNPYACKGDIRKRKPVAQYSLDGTLLQYWDSVYDAANHYAVNPKSISCCASGFKKSYKKCIWKYFDGSNPPATVPPYVNNTGKVRNGQNEKPVNQYDLHGNLINTWKSQAEIVRQLGYSRHVLKDHLHNKKNPCAYGFRWEFA